MADHTIRLKLATEYAGEGITRVNTGLQQFSSKLKSSLSPIRQFGTALGTIDGSAGKVLSGITGIVGAFSQFGLVSGIITGVQATFKIVSDKIVEHYNSIATAAKNAADAMDRRLGNIVSGILTNMSTRLTEIGSAADADAKSLDLVAASAAKVNAAMGNSASSASAANIVNIKLETLNKVITAENENAAKLAQAEGDLQVALAERANAMRESAEAVKTAKTEEKEAQRKLATAQKNLTNAKDALRQAEDNARDLENSGLTDEAALNKARQQLTAAKNLMKAREDQLVVATAAAKVAREGVTAADNKAKAAVGQYELSVKKAQMSLDDLKKQNDKAKNAAAAEQMYRDELSAAEKEKAEAEDAAAKSVENLKWQREAVESSLSDAKRRSAQWEKEHVESQKSEFAKYTTMQKHNIEILNKMYDKAPTALNAAQVEMVAKWRQWLSVQGTNPFTCQIEKMTAEVDALDYQTKFTIKCVEQNQKKAADNIAALKSALEGCLKLR